jgi:hypothetical protein
VLILGVGAFLERSSQLRSSQELAADRLSTIQDLTTKVGQLTGNLDDANSQISDLEWDKSSLTSALGVCRDAAEQGLKAVASLYGLLAVSYWYGSEAVSDLRELKSKLSWCRVQANSSGVL